MADSNASKETRKKREVKWSGKILSEEDGEYDSQSGLSGKHTIDMNVGDVFKFSITTWQSCVPPNSQYFVFRNHMFKQIDNPAPMPATNDMMQMDGFKEKDVFLMAIKRGHERMFVGWNDDETEEKSNIWMKAQRESKTMLKRRAFPDEHTYHFRIKYRTSQFRPRKDSYLEEFDYTNISKQDSDPSTITNPEGDNLDEMLRILNEL